MRVTHRSHKREGTKESRGEQESKKRVTLRARKSPPHRRISPSQADKWKQVQVPPPGLAAATKRLGWQHGYRFRTFPGFAFIDETAEDGCVCWFKRGAFRRVAILFVKSAPRGLFYVAIAPWIASQSGFLLLGDFLSQATAAWMQS